MDDKKSLIVAENLSKSFKKIEVVKNFTTNFNEGERIALIGQNGAGKTTLIRCVLGHYVYGGNLNVLGYEPRTQRVEMLKEVGFVPQIPPPLKMTVSEMLEFFSKITNTHKNKFIDIATNLGLQVKENMGKAFQRYLSEIGLDGKSYDLRTFRKDFISRSQEAGVPINVTASLVGHSNIKTTMTYYTKLSSKYLKKELKKLK